MTGQLDMLSCATVRGMAGLARNHTRHCKGQMTFQVPNPTWAPVMSQNEKMMEDDLTMRSLSCFCQSSKKIARRELIPHYFHVFSAWGPIILDRSQMIKTSWTIQIFSDNLIVAKPLLGRKWMLGLLDRPQAFGDMLGMCTAATQSSPGGCRRTTTQIIWLASTEWLIITGWWFGCHFWFSHILGIIIPTD